MRADLGAADVRDLVIVSGPDMESILRGAENAGRALQELADQKVIGGFESPANYLPSMATQESRRGSLPGAAELRANLKQAAENLPRARGSAAALSGRCRSDASRRSRYPARPVGNIPERRLRFPDSSSEGAVECAAARLRSATQREQRSTVARWQASAQERRRGQDARVLDLKQESDALYGSYLSEAIHFSLAGFLALTLLLLIALRSPQRVARVLAPLVLAVVTVAAGLAAAGVHLSILHLVGMLLIVAVGSNYALFFDRQAHSPEAGNQPLTLASLIIANASTVIGFGLLSFSQVPVLVALGTTVAPGTFLALLFAAIGFRGGGDGRLPEPPVRSIWQPWRRCKVRAATQMIWLPGAYDSAQSFWIEGFAATAGYQKRGTRLDLWFVDLEMSHLQDRGPLERLHCELILPAQTDSGVYRHGWPAFPWVD